MTNLPFNFQSVAIAAHPQLPEAFIEAEKIADYLQACGVKFISGSLYDDALRYQIKVKQVDLLIALGGDGTMLRAWHLCAPHGVPILGINLGKFGFLTAIQRGEWPEALGND